MSAKRQNSRRRRRRAVQPELHRLLPGRARGGGVHGGGGGGRRIGVGGGGDHVPVGRLSQTEPCSVVRCVRCCPSRCALAVPAVLCTLRARLCSSLPPHPPALRPPPAGSGDAMPGHTSLRGPRPPPRRRPPPCQTPPHVPDVSPLETSTTGPSRALLIESVAAGIRISTERRRSSASR